MDSLGSFCLSKIPPHDFPFHLKRDIYGEILEDSMINARDWYCNLGMSHHLIARITTLLVEALRKL